MSVLVRHQGGPRDSALAVAESKHQSQAQCLDVSSVDVSGLTAGTDPSDGCLNGADPDDLFLSDIEEILETERLARSSGTAGSLDFQETKPFSSVQEL